MNEANAIVALLVGIGLGVLIHRGGFCMHSGLRHVLRGEPSASFLAYLVALAAQMVIVNALAEQKLIRIPTVPLARVAAIIGGLSFGFGMAWARG
jgi:hypothetical protein